MLLSEGKYYLVAAKCDLIGQIKARVLTKTINKNIVKFIKEEFICCYSEYEILVMDKNSKNKSLISDLIRKFGIKRKVMSAYYFQINELMKWGYQPIKKILAKLTDGETRYQTRHLYLVLQTDCIIVKVSTGRTPYFILYRVRSVLSVKFEIPT